METNTSDDNTPLPEIKLFMYVNLRNTCFSTCKCFGNDSKELFPYHDASEKVVTSFYDPVLKISP